MLGKTLDIKESKLTSKVCLRCNKENEVTNKFCNYCGLVLDQQQANNKIRDELDRKETYDIMSKIMNNKELLQMLVKKMNEMK